MESVSLLEMFRYYRWDGKEKTFVKLTRGKQRTIDVWPNYIPDRSDPAMYENWCRAKLQLNHPYRNLDDLRLVDDEHVEWSVASENCKDNCVQHEDDPLGNEGDLETEEEEDEFEEQEETEEERVIRNWQELGRRGP